MSESNLEETAVFMEGKYPERFFCPGCSRYYLAEDCEQPVGRARCPKCNRWVRTRPRNKNHSRYVRKYIDV